MPLSASSKQTVLSFIKALNEEDFQTARKYVSDDLKFVGVMGTREGADVYVKDMEKMKFKYDVKKAFADGNDVCLWYDIDMGGRNIFSCGWYHVEHHQIKWFKVLFDPRPLLEKAVMK
jgi:limonene-1,2-epoxide hydrolase